MKAKELLDKARMHEGNPTPLQKGYVFTEEEMAIFWSQLCKEQRDLCSETVGFFACEDQALNAPEPEIE